MPLCSIVGCGSYYYYNAKNKPKITLHRLPSAVKKRTSWLEIIGVENVIMSHKIIFVCSLHFEDSCFNRTLDQMKLRDGSLPSLQLPKSTVEIAQEIKDEKMKILLNKGRDKERTLKTTDSEPSPMQRFKGRGPDKHVGIIPDKANQLERCGSKDTVIDYMCDRSRSITPTDPLCETTGKLLPVANGSPMPPHVLKQELKLRLINNNKNLLMYETVSEDERVEENVAEQDAALPQDKKKRNEYWKLKLSHILHKTQFCGLCLAAGDKLNEISDEFEMFVQGTTHSKTLSEIEQVVFKETENLISNSQICNSCTTKLIQSYMFIENTKEKSKMLNYHLNELYNKTCYTLNILNDSEDPDKRNVVFSLENTDHRHIETNINHGKQPTELKSNRDIETNINHGKQPTELKSNRHIETNINHGKQPTKLKSNRHIETNINHGKQPTELKSNRHIETNINPGKQPTKLKSNRHIETNINHGKQPTELKSNRHIETNINHGKQPTKLKSNRHIETNINHGKQPKELKSNRHIETNINHRKQPTELKSNRLIETNINHGKQPTELKSKVTSIFKCAKCKISLRSYKAWKIHKATHNTNHKCKKCHQHFKTRPILMKHTNHFKTKCKICRASVQVGGLLSHLKKYHKSIIHLCTLCGTVYHSKAFLAHNKTVGK